MRDIGPALSARGRDVAITWFTAVDDTAHAYVAFSADAGRTFGARADRRRADQGAGGRRA